MPQTPDYIPVIDIAGLASGDPAQTRRIADQVAQAFAGSGFCYIRNHGIAADIIEDAAREAMAFFRQPLEEKLKVAPKKKKKKKVK